MVAGPLIGAAARAFAAGGSRLAAGTRWGARGWTAARIGAAAYRNRGIVTGREDPRAIIGAALNCDEGNPAQAGAILARARARSVTGRLYEKVSEILSDRGCAVPGESALVDAANTAISAAGTIAGAAFGAAAIGLGALAGGGRRQVDDATLESQDNSSEWGQQWP
jgi:hypothetical protein